MAKRKSSPGVSTANGEGTSSANIGFEAKLWLAADKLRNNMDAAEYKHVVLGLIFLKYISDTFDEHHSKLVAGKGDYKGANPEDKDDGEPFEEKMTRLVAERHSQFAESAKLEKAIKANLKGLGYG
jgi:type I restriction-modification system DNA methylase subunit